MHGRERPMKNIGCALNKQLKEKILFDEINDTHLSLIETPNAKNLHKLAIQYSDFVYKTKLFNNKDVISFMEKLGMDPNNVLENQSLDDVLEVYNNLCATEVV